MDLLDEIRSFKPIDIDKILQDDNVSQKQLDSFKSYNKAIENLRTGSEDIAMIELKKIVSSNPDFYEAINLLGLCYAYTKQLDKAEELFGRVVQNENDVIKAADYLKYIGKNDFMAQKNKNNSAKPAKKAIVTKVPEKKVSKDIPAEYMLFDKIAALLKRSKVTFIVNIFSVICLIAALILFVSATKSDKPAADTKSESAANTQLNQQYEALKAENSSLKKQLDETQAKIKQAQITSDLSQVTTLYGQGKYEEAADKLMALPVSSMSADQKKTYDSIKSDVLQKAAYQLTAEGNASYNAQNYNDAIKKLEKVFKLGDKWTFGDKALYILGKSYVEVNDNQKGAAAYQKLIQQYPQSGYVKYAKSRLQSIQ